MVAGEAGTHGEVLGVGIHGTRGIHGAGTRGDMMDGASEAVTYTMFTNQFT